MTQNKPLTDSLLIPDWPMPGNVRAASTLRTGGCSEGPWESLNLAEHVGDVPEHVAANRLILSDALQLPAEPLWLQQVHGCEVKGPDDLRQACRGDARVTDQTGQVCTVLTADCLPILLCNKAGNRVAAIHAGWRGLAAGVIEDCLQLFSDHPADILAWLGPAIGPSAFEVGSDVREAFVRQSESADVAFKPNRPGHWLADMYLLARQRLASRGVTEIYGGGRCTWSEPESFFSYRRDGVTGRMASLIWLLEN